MKGFFKDKVIWITGASSGIGESLAIALSQLDTRLILSSRREGELNRVRESCKDPDKVRLLPLDLTNVDFLEEKVAQAISLFGQIDVMVHNGGISQRSLVRDTTMEIHRHVMELDYFSYIAITRYLLPHFLERKSGHFVVTSSVMGKVGTPMRSAYAAAKHALHGYFDCLRAEVAPEQIRVTILTPGYIRTNISKHLATDKGLDTHKESRDIIEGLPADKAAIQIIRAIRKGKLEAYIGKFGGERIALWLNRYFPGIFARMAVKLTPH
ncbi:MAG: SDR family NAD(P)-dependent oxidoreductase [Bacteroidota bacterium]|nr:SDR family NAD(P)-dependent oxidoreductase [Bacteroidota bacterium]